MSFNKLSHQISVPKYMRITLSSYRLFTSAIAIFMLISCGKNEIVTPDAPPPAVSVYTINSEQVGNLREFVARTEASKLANISTRVKGELIERPFSEGRKVQEGDVLFKIDPAEYEASVAQAKADLSSKLSAKDNAIRNLKRAEELIGDGYISQSDFDRLATEKSQAESSVTSAEAALKKAELDLSYTTITAPFTGRVGRTKVNIGNTIEPSTGTLATITLTDPIYVNFQVEEDVYVTHVQKAQQENKPQNVGAELSVRLPNNTVYPEKGKLEFSDTRIDESMGTVELRSSFKNPKGLILPGLFVTLILESATKEEMALVPQAAVQENQQGKFVLVVQNSKVLQRPVELGRRMNAMWVVTSGLSSGEQVIVEGLQKVKSGVDVTPVVKYVDAITGTISEPSTSETSVN